MSDNEMPDHIGIGGASCSCGGFRILQLHSTVQASWSSRCQICGELIEVLAEESAL